MALRTQIIRNTLVAASLIGVISFAVFAQDTESRDPSPSRYSEIAVQVNGSVSETLSKITTMLADNGMMVMGELHQGKILAMTGLQIESESIFIGNPTIGKKLFSAELGAGLAVPVRLNIYKNSDGKTIVQYIPLTQQLAGFENSTVNKVCEKLDGKLIKMISMLKK